MNKEVFSARETTKSKDRNCLLAIKVFFLPKKSFFYHRIHGHIFSFGAHKLLRLELKKKKNQVGRYMKNNFENTLWLKYL